MIQKGVRRSLNITLRCATAAVLAAVFLVSAAHRPGLAQSFKDVPAEHWAADSVKTLAEAGILKGYPDGTFRGDKPVTRYEVAVALHAMIEFVRKSREPLEPVASAPPMGPHWARQSMQYLQAGGFLPEESFLLRGPRNEITLDQLGQALGVIAFRLIELEVPGRSDEAEPETEAGAAGEL